MAYSVMINASGTDPGKYVKGINGIMAKVEDSKSEDGTGDQPDLEEYTGYYSPQPWWSEVFISTWNGKLVRLGLPTEDPGNSMVFYKHIEGDVFRRIRDDDQLGETLVFERDEDGNIVRYKSHGNYNQRISR